MPKVMHPMLATAIEKPFDSPEWLFEIKWDGYRAIAFIEDGVTRLVSRNQNDLTREFPELGDLAQHIKAKTAVLDGEIVVLDDQGRPSFSLMQQRTGFRTGKRRMSGRSDLPVFYFAFDLLYCNGLDSRRVDLEQRKQALADLVIAGGLVRFSDHYLGNGTALFEVAKQKGLEGILAKRRGSCYEERRSREWLKVKITRTLECVVGGYTDPEGSRPFFGSIALGLYDSQQRLIHVGQAGSGFDEKSLKHSWELLKARNTSRSPFYGEVEALRKVHWVKPELVAEIKFTEWTHERSDSGPKLRAPVFLGWRDDKDPKECVFEQQG